MKLEDINKEKPVDNKTSATLPQQGIFTKILCWYFGLSFIVAGLVLGADSGFLAGLCCVLAGLLLLPPFNNKLIQNGLVLTKGAKAGLIFGLLILMGVMSEKNDPKAKDVSIGVSTQANVEERKVAAVELIKDSCLQVSNKFDAQSKLSDLQKDALWDEKYKNRQFEWPMEVTEVSQGMLGGLTVQFKCQQSRSFIQDVQLSYPKEAKGMIMQFEKGSVYKVKGILKMQSTLLGLSGDAVL